MKITKVLFLFISAIFLTQVISAQSDRGVGVVSRERKIALVIGNTNYDNSIGRLANPVNDATDVSDALQRLGFTLVGGKPQYDLNRKQMLELIREFGRQIKQGGIGFFYFSGHGVQVNKENYIIPITDSLVYEDDAETEAIKVDTVAKEMELAGNRLNILVLDACRNNALQKRTRNTEKGLAEPARKPEGTFIAFSAGDGQTASDGRDRNGLFTQELLKNLEKPNLRLDDIFRTTRNEVKRLSDGRQVPILYDSTSDAFVLKTDGGSANASEQKLPPTNNSAGETAFWQAIENSTNESDFQAYLRTYPEGTYSAVATLKLKNILERKEAENNKPSNAPATQSNPGSSAAVIPRQTVAFTYLPQEPSVMQFRGTTRFPRMKAEAKVLRTNKNGTEIEVSFSKMPRPFELGAGYATYVLWAISPDGQVDNVGEIKRKGFFEFDTKISVTTPLQTFALIVTAEPHFLVRRPSGALMLENLSGAGTGTSVKYVGSSSEYFRDQATPEITEQDYKTTPSTILQARLAIAMAKFVGAQNKSETEFNSAVSLLSQAEQSWKGGASEEKVDILARQAISAAVKAEMTAAGK